MIGKECAPLFLEANIVHHPEYIQHVRSIGSEKPQKYNQRHATLNDRQQNTHHKTQHATHNHPRTTKHTNRFLVSSQKDPQTSCVRADMRAFTRRSIHKTAKLRRRMEPLRPDPRSLLRWLCGTERLKAVQEKGMSRWSAAPRTAPMFR